MKVCHFIASKGLGRGEFYLDLVNELSKTLDIHLVVPKNAKFLHRVSTNVNIVELESSISRFNPFLALELYRIFKNLNPTIVHTHFAKATAIFYWINKVFKLKHIATKHNPRKAKIYEKIKYLTAVSKDVAISINHENVKIIYNGISPKLDLPCIQHPKTPFTISAIGRLDKIKGYDILIEECSKLQFDFILQIVGNGSEKEKLASLIQKYNLNGKVILLGFKENIPEIMNNSDLIVISSHSEGFSLTMIEALFYAPLLISTKVSGATEILDDAFLIENFHISKKIEEIHQHYDIYHQHFQNLKRTLQKRFLLNDIAMEYKVFYHSIVGKNHEH